LKLGRLLLAGLAFLAIAFGLFWVWLQSSLPQTAGRLTLPGLRAAVEVVRDARGVPRITASSEHDAYFALGWVHAQDRLWQMELQRRAGAGRLAEVLGASALETDKFIRTLGLYELTEASLARMPAEVTAVFEAYAAGINAWLRHREGALPPEFQILGFEPGPWRPADSLVWQRLMGLQLTGNWREELLRVRVLDRIPADKAAQLWAPYPPEAPTTLGLVDDATAATMLAAVPEVARDHLASNIWIVDGSRTASGKPLLANDPHLGFQAPILWYLATIEAPGLTVSGATVPGLPFHLLGHNGRVAWGITTTHSDTMDLFVEKPGPQDGTYLAPEGPLPFLTREEVIPVDGAEAVTITVRATRHGPVVSDVLGAPPADGSLLALSSATLQPRDMTALAFYRMNRAADVAAFREALRFFHSPQQNVAYADVAGGVGFSVPGLVPIRRRGDGLLPRPGWTGEWDWTGWVPFDELPHMAAAEGGRIVNANNKPVPDGYPHLLAAHWPEPYRAERIAAALDAAGRHDIAGAIALMYDARSPVGLRFKALAADLVVDGDGAKAAQRLLAAWDGEMARDRPEPLIVQAWLLALQQALIADDLGELARSFTLPRPLFLELALSAAPHWCDDARTPAAESCAEIAADAFEAAVAELASRHGADIAAWRWGDVHRATFEHALFEHLPVLAGLSRLAIATEGGDFTVNRGTFTGRGKTPFAHTHGAGLRAVYDLSDLADSRFAIATGQSGNLLSPHYDDMLEPWRDGLLLPLAAAGDRTLILEPPP